MDIRKRTNNSNFVTAILALLVLLLAFTGITYAWFTSGSGLSVEMVVNIGGLNLKMYQSISGSRVEINTLEDNADSATASYVDITNGDGVLEIRPDTTYTLNLILSNEDAGSEAPYIRYKIEMYAQNYPTDILLNPNITISSPSTDTGAGVFVLDSDGYYYYQNSSTGNPIEYSSGTSKTMISTFTIPYSDYYNNPNINGNSIKIVITVEGSDTGSW